MNNNYFRKTKPMIVSVCLCPAYSGKGLCYYDQTISGYSPIGTVKFESHPIAVTPGIPKGWNFDKKLLLDGISY
jgi:hypothetical protein